MAKSATKVAKASKADTLKVKNAGVTKSSQTPKAKAKEAANATAKNIDKKKKKVVEPESSDSDSDSDSESEASDSDSDSDASEEEAPKKAATNGKKAKAAESDSDSDSDSDEEEEDDSDSDSDSDESEEEEKAAPKTNGAKTNGKKAAEDSDDSDSDSDSDEDSEEEKAAPKANGKKAEKDSDSDEDSDDSDDSDSDSDEEEEEETKAEAPSKKRKAEEEIDEAPKKAKADVDAATTLFAGSLSWGVTDDSLYQAFESFGGLVGARVVTDKNTGRSRGFGYVDFDNSESATKAYEAMQGQEIDGRALNLDYANAKPAEANPANRAADRAKRHGDTLSPESDTLFVGNLPFEVEQEAVREFFGEVAEVASVRLPTDPESGNLKGFGYVTFNSIEDAKTALEAKNGAAIGNGRMSRAIRLDFAGSRPPQRDGNGFGGGRGGGGFRGGRGGGRGGPRGGGRGGFGGRGGGRGGFNSPRGGGFSGTKISFD